MLHVGTSESGSEAQTTFIEIKIPIKFLLKTKSQEPLTSTENFLLHKRFFAIEKGIQTIQR